MSDKVLYETPFLQLIERDGWYYFAQVPNSPGGIIILLYRTDKEKSILGRYEICPAHNDGLSLTAISGGIEIDESPLDAAIREAYEEARYDLGDTPVIGLGKCNLSTNQDTLVYLYAANVTNLPRMEAPGDGTKGEEGSYCDWVTPEEAINSKSAFMSTMILRLKLKGINLV